MQNSTGIKELGQKSSACYVGYCCFARVNRMILVFFLMYRCSILDRAIVDRTIYPFKMEIVYTVLLSQVLNKDILYYY